MTALDTAVRRLRKIAGDGTADRDLLARYTSRRDADAFGELVRRHGPAVWGVCRRILSNQQDAEDAFQTTFIALARKAGSVRHPDALGCWLHGVAVRTATKSRGRRRPTSELPDLPSSDRDEPTWRDVRRVLDEELARLPERWRLPVVLCHLDGLTRDEAAKLLGWTLGTLRGRLEDGRNRLRDQLARRGVELSAALLAVAAASEATALPSPLRDATMAAVHSLSPGLVMGKLQAMTLFAIVAGLGATAFTFRGEGGEPAKTKQPDAPVKAELPAEIAKLFASADRIWVVEGSKPVEVLKGMTTPASIEWKVEAFARLPKEGRRIVFLKSIDEVDHLPKLEPIAGDTWHLPADDATVAALRAHVPACEWGKEVSGLRLGIIARAGDEPTVEVVLQNVGEKTLTPNQFRGIYMDGWPQLKFDVTRPDGVSHRLERHAKPPKDGDAPNARELKPGERHIQVVRLNRWLIAPDGGNAGNAPASLFAAAADYRVQATYLLSDPRSGERGVIAVAQSGTAKVTVPEPGLFGERVGDLRMRLQQPKGPIKSGGFPTLVCDLENHGAAKRSVFTMPENAAIELDGVWHHCFREGSFSGKTHEVGTGTLGDWLTVTPSGQWMHLVKGDRLGQGGIEQVAKPFELTWGRHTLRVAYTVDKDVRLVSNAVTIDVDTDGWGQPAGGYRTRLRPSKARFAAGEPLSFELDLWNTNDKPATFPAQPFKTEVMLDGSCYVNEVPVGGSAPVITVASRDRVESFLEVTTGADWRLDVEDGFMPAPPLQLAAGKHKLKVAIKLDKFKAMSNEVEIEVDPLSKEIMDIARKADRIWVVNAPTPEKPVPDRVGVLKGPAGPPTGHFDLRQLPGTDPKARFIVFLTSEEDGVGPAKASPWRRAGHWYVSHSADAEAAVRRLMTENVAWGEERGGLRLGLRFHPEIVAKGKPVSAEVVIQNVGKSDATVEQLRLNIYDYWPNTTFEVTRGEIEWTLAKPSGAMDEFDKLLTMTLKPGECYVHAVRLTEWKDAGQRREAVPKAYSESGQYTIKAKVGALTSAPAKLTVKEK